MAAKKATTRKPVKLKKVFATRTIAEINALIKTTKKLDLELKEIKKRIDRMLGHQYFS
jgi:hypothetical protein